MYPWKTLLTPNRDLPSPVYLQLANAIIQEISAGRIQAGQKLPGTRALAELIGLNRKTVIIAFEELAAQGWIELQPSRGAFVSEKLPLDRYRPIGEPASREVNAETAFELEIDTSLPILKEKPQNSINFTDGTPDVRLAPMDSLYRYCRFFARTRMTTRYLTYGDVQGEIHLRTELANYLNKTRGLRCNPENVFISRGSQMSIFLSLKALLKPGDVVIVGETSYPVVDQVVEHLGGRLIRVPVDEDGMQVEAIRKICHKETVRAVYLTPHHHFPTTVTLCADRRIQLLEYAHIHRFAIIEDDYDYDFHYTSSPMLPMASLDRSGSVIYLGSFSKIIAPAVRIGYLIAPLNMIEALNRLRKIIDRQGDSVMERALAEMLREGEIQRHIKKSLKVYRSRRDYLCQKLTSELGEWITFTPPDGGMAIWANFSPQIDLPKLASQLREKDIILDIQHNWLKEGNGIRLGFASVTETEIDHIITHMKQLISAEYKISAKMGI
jgi:GntR family transcriptional regulator/MocR family aminotransferase